MERTRELVHLVLACSVATGDMVLVRSFKDRSTAETFARRAETVNPTKMPSVADLQARVLTLAVE